MNGSWLVGVLAVALNARADAGQIDVGTPIVSGESSRTDSSHVNLPALQVQQLTQWLEQHSSGWHGMIAAATAEPARFTVCLQHDDGSVTVLAVIARSTRGYYLRIIGPGKWAYRSFGGLFKSWAAERTLSDQEFATLLRMVGET